MATKGAISNQQFKAAQAAVNKDAQKRSAEEISRELYRQQIAFGMA